ncbi:zinc finger protein 777-like [Melospiza georgiana]|uniref:zinc finger protein 777-like n=1 Tax=Melospiza georgiana TaxID=44398 RepID=UPI0025AC4EA7|nr:zinc finger protein 777-like [Melospiza georgiana]
MAELPARLEALERRMERAEAALRELPLAALQLHGVRAAMGEPGERAGLAGGAEGETEEGWEWDGGVAYGVIVGPEPVLQVPVRFEDVAVRFSRQEWASLDEGQKEMYRSVMEGNYEMLVSLYSALSKPELLLQLESEELSTPPESETEAEEMSPELAVEPARQNCTSDDALLETETMDRGCREPEESGNVAEKSENLVEESWGLVEIRGNVIKEIWDVAEENRSSAEENKSQAEENKSQAEENRSQAEDNRSQAEENRSSAEENRSSAEENRSSAEENRSQAEENRSSAEENKSQAEENRSSAEEIKSQAEEIKSQAEEIKSQAEEIKSQAEDNRSSAEGNRSPAKESGNPAEETENLMEESSSPVVPENCSTPPVPLEAPAVPADLSQPRSPPCLLPVHCQDAVAQNSPPPAAGDAEAGIPMEVPQEEVAAENLSMPKTPSKGQEEDKGHEEEAMKDPWNTGQDLVADIPEEPGKEVAPDVHKMTEQADPSPGEPEKDSCVGRPVPWQRNSAREFYSCPICRKTFLLKINLLIHQRGHTNWVPYVCVHCDRKFMSKKKIRRHLRAWAANGTCQPSELEVCPSQVPFPASHPQTWPANGMYQASKPEECPSRTPCPTSQPQTWAPNGSCQPLDANGCPSQGMPCPTSQPQAWAPNGPCQPLDAKACPSQGPCPSSQCPTSQPQTWAANGTCQASKPEECPSQSLCPSSQPQTPSRDCGTVWQEPGPARCSLPPGKVMYTCTECRESFSNQVFLTVHQRRHSGHHLILCPCCNRSFTWVSDFVRQHWMLMGVRPHQCGICQKTFKRFSHLKAHQRIHRRQERPFACANPGPVVAAPAAGDGVGSQAVTPQGWGPAVGP